MREEPRWSGGVPARPDRSLTICPDLRGALAGVRREPAKADLVPGRSWLRYLAKARRKRWRDSELTRISELNGADRDPPLDPELTRGFATGLVVAARVLRENRVACFAGACFVFLLKLADVR